MQIRLFIGPVSSGKTTRLIELYEHHAQNGWNVLAVTHANEAERNKKLAREEKIGCKSGRTIPGKYLGWPELITRACNPVAPDVILIDEAQFFPAKELVTCITKLRQSGVREAILFGLSSDFQIQPWEAITTIIPFCNVVSILPAQCSECGREALFSSRIDSVRHLVSMKSKYEPRCHDHWRAPGEKL